MTDFTAVDRYVDEHMSAWTDELSAFCAIPSEETDPEAVRRAAAWTAARLERLGATVSIFELPDIAPLVSGTIGRGRRLIAVQHYDVQPSVPLDLWTTPPYDPHVRDGRLFARGAADNKGEFLARVWGVEAYLAVNGSLPCEVRFLVEGEEEHGSPNLDRLLDLDPDLRAADGALTEGGGIDVAGRPEIDGGGRGMVEVELRRPDDRLRRALEHRDGPSERRHPPRPGTRDLVARRRSARGRHRGGREATDRGAARASRASFPPIRSRASATSSRSRPSSAVARMPRRSTR